MDSPFPSRCAQLDYHQGLVLHLPRSLHSLSLRDSNLVNRPSKAFVKNSALAGLQARLPRLRAVDLTGTGHWCRPREDVGHVALLRRHGPVAVTLPDGRRRTVSVDDHGAVGRRDNRGEVVREIMAEAE